MVMILLVKLYERKNTFIDDLSLKYYNVNKFEKKWNNKNINVFWRQ